MRRSLAQTETSSEAVWTVLSRRLADATQLVNCSTACENLPFINRVISAGLRIRRWSVCLKGSVIEWESVIFCGHPESSTYYNSISRVGLQ